MIRSTKKTGPIVHLESFDPLNAYVLVKVDLVDRSALVAGTTAAFGHVTECMALMLLANRFAKFISHAKPIPTIGSCRAVKVLFRQGAHETLLYSLDRDQGGPVDRGSSESVPAATAAVTSESQRGKARQRRSHSSPDHSANKTPTPSRASSSSPRSRPKPKKRRAPRLQKS